MTRKTFLLTATALLTGCTYKKKRTTEPFTTNKISRLERNLINHHAIRMHRQRKISEWERNFWIEMNKRNQVWMTVWSDTKLPAYLNHTKFRRKVR